MHKLVLVVVLATTASAQTTKFKYEGVEASDALGSAIVDAGDVDGDTVRDFVIGVPRETDNGTLRFYSGASGTLIRAIHGPYLSSQFGFSLENVGDVDSDGIDDLAAGDPSAVPGQGVFGAVHVFSGATGVRLYSVYGPSAQSSFFGQTVAKIGDLDGDGVSDFLVAAFFDSTVSGLGSARLFSGSTGAAIQVLTVPPPAFSSFASCVEGLGDIDGDQVPDFAISAIAASAPGLQNCGRVWVYSGATLAPLYDFFGPHAEAAIGSSLARVDDVDGDGRDDLLVGAEGLGGAQVTGRAYLHSGATGALLHTFHGDSNLDRFGACVAGLGDLDQDGTTELAIGSRIGSYVKVFSGASGAWLFTIRETNTGWMIPMAVARLGDLDGDGRPEIGIGSGADSAHGQFSGRARIVSDGTTPISGAVSCFGDSSAGACPCGNPGGAGAGCASSVGDGARLAGLGTTSVADDLFFLAGDGLPSNTLTVLFSGTSTSPVALAPAGDGLRCIGGTIRRVMVRNANQAGAIWDGPTLQPAGGWLAGESRHFQLFYRNPNGPCGTGFNVSNAVSVQFTP
jgi:hypothetical protein